MVNIDELIKYSYISLEYAYLRVFVKNINIFEPLFDLRKITTDSDGDIISVPDTQKRNIYNIPDFIESIQKSRDKSFENCLLIMVLDGYEIEKLHKWIENYIENHYNKTYTNGL